MKKYARGRAWIPMLLLAAGVLPQAADAQRRPRFPNLRGEWGGLMTFDSATGDDGTSEELDTLFNFARQDSRGRLRGGLAFVTEEGETDPVPLAGSVTPRGQVNVTLGSRRTGFLLRYALQTRAVRAPSVMEGRWAFASPEGRASGDAFFLRLRDEDF